MMDARLQLRREASMGGRLEGRGPSRMRFFPEEAYEEGSGDSISGGRCVTREGGGGSTSGQNRKVKLTRGAHFSSSSGDADDLRRS